MAKLKPGDVFITPSSHVGIVLSPLHMVDADSNYYTHDTNDDMPVLIISPLNKMYTNGNTTAAYKNMDVTVVGHFDPADLHKECQRALRSL